MQSRRVMLAVLLIGIALFSALIGLIIGRSGGARGRELTGRTVSGIEISRGDGRAVRLYEGPRIAAQFAYWLEGNSAGDRFLVSCCNDRSRVIFSVYYTRSGANVHAGPTRSSPIIYHFEGGTAYEGPTNKGPAVWSECGNDDICTGKGEQGPQVYHVERGRIYPGPRVTTEVLLTADDPNYEDDSVLMLLVPIFVENLWEQW